MSLSLTEIQAVTDDYVDKTPVDIYFQDNVLLWKLLGNGNLMNNLVTGDDLVDGGQKIRCILEYGEGNSGSYGSTTKIELGKRKIYNAARFRWAGYFASNTIDLDDRVQNTGDAAMLDSIAGKLTNIQKTIRKKMGGEIYDAAADASCFLGLGDLFNTTTSTAYGEIAEDDMANWKANLIAAVEAISYAVMQKIRRTASLGQNNGDKPDIYVTTDVLVDAYERGLQTQQRFSDAKLVDAGFENVLFKRAPVVADDRQTAGYLDALNLRYLSIKTHSDYNFTRPKWEYSRDQPDTLTANVRWIGQLICKNRKAHCRHTNLKEPS
jgi:hypothetical protein